MRRQQHGELHGLIQELKMYCDCFFCTYFRMSVGQAELLLAYLEEHLRRQNNNFRNRITQSSIWLFVRGKMVLFYITVYSALRCVLSFNGQI